MFSNDRKKLALLEEQQQPVKSAFSGSGQGPSIAKLVCKIPEARCVNTKVDQDGQKTKVFSEKTLEFPGFPELTTVGDVTHFFTSAGVGFRCKKGKKAESPNQDGFCITCVPDEYTLYLVLDGHGPEGHTIANLAKEILVCDFLSHELRESNPEKALRDCFINCQTQIQLQTQFNAKTSGATCTMVYHDYRTGAITIANVGDCRCLLGLQTQAGAYDEIEPLTTDHRPELEVEKRRIESRGGRVVHDGFVNHRVYSKEGQYPGLNMSRALGDLIAHKEAGVTADPDVRSFRLADHAARHNRVTLFIASDGIWGNLGNKDVATIYASSGSVDTGVQSLCNASFEKAMKSSEGEICDDMTAIIIDLPLRAVGQSPLLGAHVAHEAQRFL